MLFRSNTLIRRVLDSNRLDYWEAGMDLNPGLDIYDSFKKYQTLLLKEFDRLAREFNFIVIDGRRSIPKIQRIIQDKIIETLFEKDESAASELVSQDVRGH